MSQAIRNLEPSALWNRFADLNSVPRPSKKEERIRAWVMQHCEQQGLDVERDEVGNVLVRKAATAGMEDRAMVILQSHLDMVCQKNADTAFDFDTEGIRMYVDESGDWVRAEGTTLGADNGIGAATMLAVLESTDIAHPALECLFTIDEETGMTGALELRKNWLKGTVLLNLDTEDDREIGIGCAGGVDLSFTARYDADTPVALNGIRLVVNGGSGGHSGMDIHKGIANANKVLVRLIRELSKCAAVEIAALDGGGLRNAIPREAAAVLAVDRTADQCRAELAELASHIATEYAFTDPNLKIVFEAVGQPSAVMPCDFAERLLMALDTCPNGLDRMSPDIPGLVQTSNNLARIDVKNGRVEILCLTRSSVDSEKDDFARRIAAGFELAGLDTDADGAYPGWAPNASSHTVDMLAELYEKRFGETPLILSCHAGLECGILGNRYPGLDMASIGPNITGAHSPDEKVQISSVQKFWGWFVEALAHIPVEKKSTASA
jgi:dipeptidase D